MGISDKIGVATIAVDKEKILEIYGTDDHMAIPIKFDTLSPC